MKILIVTQYFYPEQFRINDVCSALVKNGHDVTVLTGLPNYPQGEIYQGYENKGNTEESIFGARVLRCDLRPRHRGTKNLVRNYLSFVKQANKIIQRLDNDFEIIYVYGISPVTQALPAIKYKKRINKKVKIVYYCCDLWPEAVRGEQNGHKQLSRNNIVYLIAKRLTTHIYRRVDLIVNKCDEFSFYNEKVCKVRPEKQVTVFEHAEDFYLNVSEKPIDNGVVDFVFLGNIGRVQNCEQIINAASKLKATNPFMIHFVGDGSNLENIKRLASDLSVADKVKFYGRVAASDTIRFYDMADACLLMLSHRTETGITLPAKLTSYMAASRPVVASADGAAASIIEKSNCGFVCSADDEEGLLNIMQFIIDNPNILNNLGMNGRRFFKDNFTLIHHINSLEKQFSLIA